MSTLADIDLQDVLDDAAGRAVSGRTSLSVQTSHLDEELYIEAQIGSTPRNYVPDRIISMLLSVTKQLPESLPIIAYFHAENGPTPVRVELSGEDADALEDLESDAARRFYVLENFEMERVIR